MVTEKKSLAVQILTVLVLLIGAYSGLFSATGQAWLGIVSMAATLVLSTFFPSGTLPSGWNKIMWITNITGVVLQLLAAIGSAGLIDPMTVNTIIIAINIFVQVFIKNYTIQVSK
jgi:hypothetical protein